MAWLKQLVKWFIGLVVHEAVEQIKEEVKKPDTIEDAKTPDDIKAAWNKRMYAAEQLRAKDNSNRQPK